MNNKLEYLIEQVQSIENIHIKLEVHVDNLHMSLGLYPRRQISFFRALNFPISSPGSLDDVESRGSCGESANQPIFPRWAVFLK